MELIGDILARREKYKLARSERTEIIKQFVEGVNACRDGKKWKKLTPYYIAMRLGHIKKKADLYFFLAKCKQSNHFAKTFFYELKPQDTPKNCDLFTGCAQQGLTTK